MTTQAELTARAAATISGTAITASVAREIRDGGVEPALSMLIEELRLIINDPRENPRGTRGHIEAYVQRGCYHIHGEVYRTDVSWSGLTEHAIRLTVSIGRDSSNGLIPIGKHATSRDALNAISADDIAAAAREIAARIEFDPRELARSIGLRLVA